MITMKIVEEYVERGKEDMSWGEYNSLLQELVNTYGLTSSVACDILSDDFTTLKMARIDKDDPLSVTSIRCILEEIPRVSIHGTEDSNAFIILEDNKANSRTIRDLIPAQTIREICKWLEDKFYPAYAGHEPVQFRYSSDASNSPPMFSRLPEGVIEVGYNLANPDMVYFTHAKCPTIRCYVCVFS